MSGSQSKKGLCRRQTIVWTALILGLQTTSSGPDPMASTSVH